MRQVYPSSQVFHLWAHQSQDHARNSNGTVFFNRAVIFSYRESWPLAYIHENKHGKLVLTNSDRYSVTTSQHQSACNSAVSHLAQIAVPEVRPSWGQGDKGLTAEQHAGNIKYLEKEIAQHLATAQRALQVRTVEWRTATAHDRHVDLERYFAFFGIRRKLPAFPAAEFAAALARATAIETPDPIKDAAKYRAKLRREEKEKARIEKLRADYAISQAENIAKWRAGEMSVSVLPGICRGAIDVYWVIHQCRACCASTVRKSKRHKARVFRWIMRRACGA